ncbi:hypothetical protein KGM_200897 [Danaus plexippus plexippus]|uniref:Uncharacterized protein n=1 Tax=Danaus plexippus plexippus TaxID=278856 RepID=A0A212ETE1_DANPL|nr:hypothetical protein KGM_200897 [Danaus plexippus plexippus]
MSSNEGEILLQEKYGTSAKERYYVKAADQLPIVLVVNEKSRDVAGLFAKIFLPQGYPNSVSKDYIFYQIWDTAQAFCSTITGILATQEVFRGVGVGDTNASPLAATVTWVFKDGCGHIGKILFAYTHGTYLDAYSKKWRLYADTLNDAAMCIEIALPLFKNYITFALCVSTCMKAIVGVAGGATRVAMTQHHALRGNLADVSAKDSAQETAVNLIASFAALFLISLIGNSVTIFIILLIMHIVFNYMAVRAVCLRTLNEPRFLQVIDTYLRKEVIANPCEINRNEPIIFYQLGPNLLDLKICGFHIIIGDSISKILNPRTNAVYINKVKDIYNDKKYIIHPDTGNRVMYVFPKEDASVDDMLCAYFQSVLLAIITCAINDHQLAIFSSNNNTKPFAQVCVTLQSAEWSRATGSGGDFQYEPSYDLHRYVKNIASDEWTAIREGLLQTGWDLSKHLLIVDEWRLCSENVTPVAILPEEVKYNRPIAIPETRKESFTIEPDTSDSTLSNIPEATKSKTDLNYRLKKE